jgi:hypothetical protein
MKLAPRVFLCVVAIAQSSAVLGDEPSRSPLTSQLRSVLSLVTAPAQATREPPSHPLIIRVHEKALVSQAGDRVNITRPVSCVVLGTPATGTSWTTGTIRVDTSSAKDTADFLVTFRGQSLSRTIGVNGPARIHSHSVTDFVVSRHVVFCPREGFQSQPTSIQFDLNMTLDDVRATKPGLRGALIRRVGWRRATQSRAAAKQVVSGLVRRELLEAFDRHIDQRVAELNGELQAARYASALFGDSDQLNVRVCSADNCLQIAVGTREAPSSGAFFPASPAASPLEVWLHDGSLQEQSERLAGPLALLSAGAKTIPAVQTISMAAWQSAAPAGVKVRSEDGWIVLSFDAPPTNSSPPETRLARRSAN